MMTMRRARAKLLVFTVVCGCHAPTGDSPGEDMGPPAADLRRPRADLTSVDPPDLANLGPGSARWARDLHQRPQSSLDGPVAVAVDGHNSLILASTFGGTVDLGGGPLQCQGATDLLIAKYAADGSFGWAKRFGGKDGLTRAYAVAVDAADNIVVAGIFVGTIDLGGGPLNSNGTSAGDAFLVKYSADGNHLFSRRLGGTRDDALVSVAVSSSGDIFAAGVFSQSIDLGGGPVPGIGGQDIFIARYSGASGAYQWGKALGGAGSDEARVKIDPAGDLVLAGHFGGSADLGGGALTSKGETDGFIAKYTQAGDYQWSNRYGGAGADSVRAVAVDKDGNILITGQFTDMADLGGGPLAGTGAFVAKYKPSGVPLWSKPFTYKGAGAAFALALAVDSRGNIELAGEFNKTVDFGGGALTSAGGNDLWLARYSADGVHLRSQRFGADLDDKPENLAMTGDDQVVLTGLFRSTVDFGTGPLAAGDIAHSFLLSKDP